MGPVYAQEELDEQICPWCIADGTAARKYDATFKDEEGIGTCGDGQPVPEYVIEEVARRTPGFSGWQQEQWWSHCGDAGAFLGAAGYEELKTLGEDAILSIRESTGLPLGQVWEEFFQALDKDGVPTAYVFRCTKCGAVGGKSGLQLSVRFGSRLCKNIKPSGGTSYSKVSINCGVPGRAVATSDLWPTLSAIGAKAASRVS